jgi:hypothetical protein
MKGKKAISVEEEADRDFLTYWNGERVDFRIGSLSIIEQEFSRFTERQWPMVGVDMLYAYGVSNPGISQTDFITVKEYIFRMMRQSTFHTGEYPDFIRCAVLYGGGKPEVIQTIYNYGGKVDVGEQSDEKVIDAIKTNIATMKEYAAGYTSFETQERVLFWKTNLSSSSSHPRSEIGELFKSDILAEITLREAVKEADLEKLRYAIRTLPRFTDQLFKLPNVPTRHDFAKRVDSALSSIKAERGILYDEEAEVREYIKFASFFDSKYPVFDFKQEWIEAYMNTLFETYKEKNAYLTYVYEELFRRGIVKSYSERHPLKNWLEGMGQVMIEDDTQMNPNNYVFESVEAKPVKKRTVKKRTKKSVTKAIKNVAVIDKDAVLWATTKQDAVAILDAFFDRLKENGFLLKRPAANQYANYFAFKTNTGELKRMTANEIIDKRSKNNRLQADQNPTPEATAFINKHLPTPNKS